MGLHHLGLDVGWSVAVPRHLVRVRVRVRVGVGVRVRVRIRVRDRDRLGV